MKDLDFLNKLRKERKLELIETSDFMSESYEKKSRDCLLGAKILFKENLFENSVGEAYYSMYNIVQSLFFMCGIKCENHSAATILLRRLFCLEKAHVLFSKAKEERIDKQYYVTPMQLNPATDDSAKSLINTAEKFVLDINNYKRNLKLEDIHKIREKFEKLTHRQL
jgi:uncharacterized protein (UPF0332 family)